MKLLKVLYGVLDDEETRVQIGRNLVGRVLDEDDGIKVRSLDLIRPVVKAQSRTVIGSRYRHHRRALVCISRQEHRSKTFENLVEFEQHRPQSRKHPRRSHSSSRRSSSNDHVQACREGYSGSARSIEGGYGEFD